MQYAAMVSDRPCEQFWDAIFENLPVILVALGWKTVSTNTSALDAMV